MSEPVVQRQAVQYCGESPRTHDPRCAAHPEVWPPGECQCGARENNIRLRNRIYLNECCRSCADKTVARLWPEGFRP